jgi:ADP-heptose:LPS heptosyltransferase
MIFGPVLRERKRSFLAFSPTWNVFDKKNFLCWSVSHSPREQPQTKETPFFMDTTAGRRKSKLVWTLPRREEENPNWCGLFHGGKKKIQICAGSSMAGRRKSKLVWALPQREEENPKLCGLFHGGKKRIQICVASSSDGKDKSGKIVRK